MPILDTSSMPFRIPESQRWAVIEKWMLGQPRNTIAIECGLSNGAVTSIVDDWRRSAGLELATLIRDIGVTLRKLGMSAAQCATGLRVSKLAERIGLEDNSIESFLSEVYTKCQNLGVNPNHIAKYISAIVSLLDGRINSQQEAVSIQSIDTIFERRKQRKAELEDEIRNLESKLHRLQLETSRCESAMLETLQAKTRVESDLKWKTDLRAELERNGLEVDDPSKLVEATRFFKDSLVNVEEILMRFSNFKGMENAIQGQEYQLELLRRKCGDLKEMTRKEEEGLAMRKLKNREIDELKSMGFGLWELKTLRNLITELATENGQEVENGEVVKRFIADIENHYTDYLRLRSKVNQLRYDESMFRTLMVTMGHLGPTISSYLGRKPTENEVREVIKLIEGYPKATTLVDSSTVRSNEEPTQSAVQAGTASSNQVDGQKEWMKTNGPRRSQTDSTPSNANLVAYETNPRGREVRYSIEMK